MRSDGRHVKPWILLSAACAGCLLSSADAQTSDPVGGPAVPAVTPVQPSPVPPPSATTGLGPAPPGSLPPRVLLPPPPSSTLPAARPPETRQLEYYVPVTRYRWVPRWHGRFNPFQQPYIAYHLAPETTWEKKLLPAPPSALELRPRRQPWPRNSAIR